MPTDKLIKKNKSSCFSGWKDAAQESRGVVLSCPVLRHSERGDEMEDVRTGGRGASVGPQRGSRPNARRESTASIDLDSGPIVMMISPCVRQTFVFHGVIIVAVWDPRMEWLALFETIQAFEKSDKAKGTAIKINRLVLETIQC
jgi:hypothetical protein